MVPLHRHDNNGYHHHNNNNEQVWYHIHCIGVSPTKARAMENGNLEFKCPACCERQGVKYAFDLRFKGTPAPKQLPSAARVAALLEHAKGLSVQVTVVVVVAVVVVAVVVVVVVVVVVLTDAPPHRWRRRRSSSGRSPAAAFGSAAPSHGSSMRSRRRRPRRRRSRCRRTSW